jgi:hypothetical protein
MKHLPKIGLIDPDVTIGKLLLCSENLGQTKNQNLNYSTISTYEHIKI